MFYVLAIPFFMLWLYMSALFVVACVKRDNSIADIGYGMAFVVVSWVSALLHLVALGSMSPIEWVLLALVTLWGARLSLRIYLKNRGKPEDFRYAAWRASWKWFYVRSYFQVFMLQGVIVYVIALPLLLTHESLAATEVTLRSFSPLFVLGLLVWLMGFFFEAVGDLQLDRFLKDPESKGHLMTRGLWKLTRHPNYFGESAMWWGIFLIALSSGAQFRFLTLVSPLLITFLLLKVSGIPMLEAKMSQHPEWPTYAAKTRAFLPLPKRTPRAR